MTVTATATGLLSAILARLQRGDCPDSKFPDRRGDFWPLCPYHPDKSSGSFAVGPRGFVCNACGERGSLSKLAYHLGVQAKTESAGTAASASGLTLAQYAAAKHLATDRLTAWGVSEQRNERGPFLNMTYRDETAKVVAVRKRFALAKNGKRDTRFSWRSGDTPTLYGLWRLADFRQAGWLLLVEGESDCHAAWSCDLPALGVPGAQSWRPEFAETVRDFKVFVWREPDTGGSAFVKSIAANLPDARVLTPPDGFKDLADAHVLGHDLPALVEKLKASATTPAPLSTTFPLTPLGNAERLAARHGRDLLFSAGRWLVWDGARWRADLTGEVRRRAIDTVRSIYAEASKTADDTERKAIAKWALRSESRTMIADMVSLAEVLPDIAARPEQFDIDPWLLTCANGTLDLRTGELRKHDRKDYITRTTNVSYDPDAWQPGSSSLFNRVLATVTGGDADLAAFLQRVAGYTLTGDTSEECLFFVHGPTASGKSTFVEALRAAAGEYAQTADFETFLSRTLVGGARNDIARLAGARMVASIEVERGRRLAEGLVKALTGGDTVTARFLYNESFEFRPAFKLMLVANDLPRVADDDNAMWRRIVCVPFAHSIPAEKRDPRVKKTLTGASRPEVLAWAVQGCLAWQRDGLRPPSAVQTAGQEYRAAMNPLSDFLAECCLLGPQYWAASADLWDAYMTWDKGRGVVRRRDFYERLQALGCTSERAGDAFGTRGWRGIGLLTGIT